MGWKSARMFIGREEFDEIIETWGGEGSERENKALWG